MNGVGAVLGPDASTATGAAALAVVAGGFFPDGAGVGLAAGDCLAAGAALVAGVVDAVDRVGVGAAPGDTAPPADFGSAPVASPPVGRAGVPADSTDVAP